MLHARLILESRKRSRKNRILHWLNRGDSEMLEQRSWQSDDPAHNYRGFRNCDKEFENKRWQSVLEPGCRNDAENMSSWASTIYPEYTGYKLKTKDEKCRKTVMSRERNACHPKPRIAVRWDT